MISNTLQRLVSNTLEETSLRQSSCEQTRSPTRRRIGRMIVNTAEKQVPDDALVNKPTSFRFDTSESRNALARSSVHDDDDSTHSMKALARPSVHDDDHSIQSMKVLARFFEQNDDH